MERVFDGLLRRLGRTRYYPQYGDVKHRQAIRSASLHQFDHDLTEEILHETTNRQQRTGSPNRPPQPWLEAESKVWRRLARERGNRQLAADLEAAIRARRRRQ